MLVASLAVKPLHFPEPLNTVLRSMYTRHDLDQLPAHLSSVYGIDPSATEELDVGVLRVRRSDGPDWVARVFSGTRPLRHVEADAAVLTHLEAHGYPAERLASAEPISTLAGQPVLVTEFVPGVKAKLEPDVYQRIGRLVAQLHSLPIPDGLGARPAGALHHFADGPRADELEAAKTWVDAIEDRVPAPERALVDKLRAALAGADDGEGLPVTLIHPDPVAKNMVRTTDGFVYVDWSGAGIGPRVVALDQVLRSKLSAPKIMAGYGEHISLSDEEWERLPRVAMGRHLIGLAWRLVFAPDKAASIVRRISALERESKQVAAAARLGV